MSVSFICGSWSKDISDHVQLLTEFSSSRIIFTYSVCIAVWLVPHILAWDVSVIQFHVQLGLGAPSGVFGTLEVLTWGSKKSILDF